MKSENLFGIKFSENVGQIKTQVINHINDRMLSIDFIPGGDRTNLDKLMSEEGLKQYYITPDVINICQKIKISKPYNLDWIKAPLHVKKQYNFGDTFFRFLYVNGSYFVLSCHSYKNNKGGVSIKNYFMQIDLGAKKMQIADDEYAETALKLFLQLLAFIESTEIEEVTVTPGKWSPKEEKEQLKNQAAFPIVMVKTNWVKTLIRMEGFDVSGHIRLQRHGPNNSLVKSIWINPYTKKGYTLKAGKIKEEENSYE